MERNYKCPHCGGNIYKDAEICNNCGKDIKNISNPAYQTNVEKTCRYCGSKMGYNEKKCPKCGMSTKEAKVSLAKDNYQNSNSINLVGVIFGLVGFFTSIIFSIIGLMLTKNDKENCKTGYTISLISTIFNAIRDIIIIMLLILGVFSSIS